MSAWMGSLGLVSRDSLSDNLNIEVLEQISDLIVCFVLAIKLW